MSDQFKQLAPIIWSEIQKANNILLHCHRNSDLDSIGSALGLKLALDKLGKQATVIAGDDLHVDAGKVLPKHELILEKDFPSVDLDQFDIFISLDSSSPDQITRNIELKFPLKIKTIVIDHHKSSTDYGDINLVEPNSSSTGEMVYELLKLHPNFTFDKDIASCLFMAIWSDTGGFRFIKGSGALHIAAELVDMGIDSMQMIQSALSIPAQNIKYVGYGLNLLKEHFNGQVITTQLSLSKLTEMGLLESLMSQIYKKVTYEMQSSSQAAIVAVLYEKSPGVIGMSLRSPNPDNFRDVLKIGLKLGGGGHPFAAGGRYSGTLDQAERELLSVIHEIYPDLGQP